MDLFYYRHCCLRTPLYGIEYGQFKFGMRLIHAYLDVFFLKLTE